MTTIDYTGLELFKCVETSFDLKENLNDDNILYIDFYTEPLDNELRLMAQLDAAIEKANKLLKGNRCKIN